MKGNATRNARAVSTQAAPLTFSELSRDMLSVEKAPMFVLGGLLITMLGIGSYIATISHTGEHASILSALTTQGPIGWASAILLIGGVVMWSVGSFAWLRLLSRAPDECNESWQGPTAEETVTASRHADWEGLANDSIHRAARRNSISQRRVRGASLRPE